MTNGPGETRSDAMGFDVKTPARRRLLQNVAVPRRSDMFIVRCDRPLIDALKADDQSSDRLTDDSTAHADGCTPARMCSTGTRQSLPLESWRRTMLVPSIDGNARDECICFLLALLPLLLLLTA